MKGKISNQRTPIIFASVTGKVYENGSMPKISKVTKVEPKVIVKENVVTEIAESPIKLTALQMLMNEKFPNLHHDTRDSAINSFPIFPTAIKDQIIMQGYAVEDVFNVIENYKNIDNQPTIELPIQIDESLFSDIPAINPVEPYPNQDNTNKNTKSSDKKLLFLGVGLGLGILLLTLNN